MITFTVAVMSSATNAAGTAFGQQPDLLTPSFWDAYITNSSNPSLLPNGVYDGWCLDPNVVIGLAPTSSYSADGYAGNVPPVIPVPPPITAFPSLSQEQLDQLNWLLAQNFTSDGKYGGAYNDGEVQVAIWKIIGITDAQINSVIADSSGIRYLTDNLRNTLNLADANTLVAAAQSAIAGGNNVLPIGTYFTTLIDPAGTYQPLIIQKQSGKLGNFVWLDTNGNGIQDSGEAGVNHVLVKLLDGAGNEIASTYTGDDYSTVGVIEQGYYQFTGLQAGDYRVAFVAPTYAFTTADVAPDDAVDSDANPLTGLSQVVTLPVGGSNQTVDAGLIVPVQLASLGDYVWVDGNNNGQQGDGAASGLNGVTVNLYTGAGAFVATTTTANDTSNNPGYYLFKDLVPGSYKVEFVKPAGYAFTTADQGADATDSDADTTTGMTIPTTLDSGENDLTWDAGLVQLASLGDYVWVDGNNNGQQGDGAASGLNGVTVNLYTGAGAFVATTTTANDTNNNPGYYLFKDLVPGSYKVEFVKPSGYAFTTADQGADATDSDADTTTGKTQIVTLASGEHNPTLDAGVILVTPKIDIEKKTDGSPNSNPTAPDYDNEDAANGAGVPILTPGSTVTWTYQVTNTGNTTFKTAEIAIVDDNGTVGSTADDMTLVNGKITLVAGQAAAADNLLQPGETWAYQATGVVQSLTTISSTPAVLDFSGSSASTGTSGNIRTFTAGGVSVKASAFSRDSSGAWASAYLGSYSGGLGVTDGSEDGSSPNHAVDNVGRVNYVLFEFDQNVVVDSTTLGWVSGDSDLTAWIGTTTDPFNNHLTLNNTVLNNLGYKEDNDTTSSALRTADLNAGNRSGNVLVIAASTSDTTPDDYFKIDQVKVQQAQTGIYENKATVTAQGASDSDLSHYKNSVAPTPTPKIDIEKKTNGPSNSNSTAPDYDNEDAANGAGVPILTPGSTVTWTYQVTNTGNTTFKTAEIAIVDDNGTVGSTADDMTLVNGKITLVAGQAAAADNLLQPGETWAYQATGVVQSLTTISSTPAVLDFSGSSASTGTSGNIRTFTAGGVSVKASAFSRDSSGAWASAYLGSYSGGLGVTDGSESGSSPNHAVDNVGRVNYVLFEFDQNVVVDSTTLGWVSDDSDLTAWIGTTTDPFNNHLTLNNTVLNNLGYKEDNDTTSSAIRTADLNAGNRSGNVLVIAASTSDTTPDDYFKIDQVKVEQVLSGIYKNKATVTAQGASDSDLSHYKNPAASLASVGDKVWDDMDHDNVQDTSEPGIAGITVKLMDATGTTILATTTTNSNGNYLFSNLNPGTYVLQFDKTNVQHYNYGQWNNMSNWKWAVKDTGTNDAIDSDVAGNAIATTNITKTSAFTLVAGQNDLTRDAGITPIVIDLDGNGIQTVSRADSGGSFDLFGNGSAVASGWISGGDGFLAVDKNGNGKIDSISELFGGTAKGAGFAQLTEYDSNGDGLVNAADAAFADLRIWRDINGNHQTDDGELMTLAEAGVSQLVTAYTELPFLDRQGNASRAQQRDDVRRTDGGYDRRVLQCGG